MALFCGLSESRLTALSLNTSSVELLKFYNERFVPNLQSLDHILVAS
jgi:hypothetical protein